MYRSSFYLTALPALLLLTMNAERPVCADQSSSRIPETGELAPQLSSGTVKLRGYIPSQTIAESTKLGSLSNNKTMSLAIVLKLRNKSVMDDQLLHASRFQNLQSKQKLTLADFQKKFSPSKADYELVTEFFRKFGYSVTRTYAHRLVIDVSAPVSVVEKTLSIQLLRYRHNTRGYEFYAPNTQPTLPIDIASKLVSIVGLNSTAQLTPGTSNRNTAAHVNTPITSPLYLRRDSFSPTISKMSNRPGATIDNGIPMFQALPIATSMSQEADTFGLTAPGVVGPGSTPGGTGHGGYFSPSDMKSIYGLSSVALDGFGQTVGLVEFDGFVPANVSAYAAYYTPSSPAANTSTFSQQVVAIPVDQASVPSTPITVQGEQEAEMDIELVLGICPNVKINVYKIGARKPPRLVLGDELPIAVRRL